MITDLSKGQLTTILSALCGVQRNPASRAAAIAAIEKQAKAIDLSLDDIFAAADGLLDGRMTAAAWRATLRGEADADATAAEAPTGAPEAEPANEPATDEPAAPTAPEGGTGGATETQPEARVSMKQLLAACEAADYWLRAERDRPGRPGPTTFCAPCAPPSIALANSRAGRPPGNSRANRARTPSKPASSRCCTKARRSARWPASSAGCGIPATARSPG